MLLFWTTLAGILERAMSVRTMTHHQRMAYRTVIAELREKPLAGRRCTGCGGELLQRPISDTAVTFAYDCRCPGSSALDRSLGWGPVPLRPHEGAGGIDVPALGAAAAEETTPA